jgi:hypothetical protein
VRVTAVAETSRPGHPNGRPRQLSLFGVEANLPRPADLEGLLLGPGQVTRIGGTARVSIVVDALWRASVLLDECAMRGLAASCEPSTVEGHIAFRTAYSSALSPLGERWLRGAMKAAPGGLTLDGQRLRLWVAACGSPDGAQAFTLRLGTGGESSAGAALAGVGLPATLLGPRSGGPAYRIVGRRRLARLVELVGDPPSQAPEGTWPV